MFDRPVMYYFKKEYGVWVKFYRQVYRNIDYKEGTRIIEELCYNVKIVPVDEKTIEKIDFSLHNKHFYFGGELRIDKLVFLIDLKDYKFLSLDDHFVYDSRRYVIKDIKKVKTSAILIGVLVQESIENLIINRNNVQNLHIEHFLNWRKIKNNYSGDNLMYQDGVGFEIIKGQNVLHITDTLNFVDAFIHYEPSYWLDFRNSGNSDEFWEDKYNYNHSYFFEEGDAPELTSEGYWPNGPYGNLALYQPTYYSNLTIIIRIKPVDLEDKINMFQSLSKGTEYYTIFGQDTNLKALLSPDTYYNSSIQFNDIIVIQFYDNKLYIGVEAQELEECFQTSEDEFSPGKIMGRPDPFITEQLSVYYRQYVGFDRVLTREEIEQVSNFLRVYDAI